MFLALVGLLGVSLPLSLYRFARMCSRSVWWKELYATHETRAQLLSGLLMVALFVVSLALYGLLMLLFDVRHERQILALSAWAYCAGVWVTSYFKKNDYLKW